MTRDHRTAEASAREDRIESLLSARLFVEPQLAGDRLVFVSSLSGHLSLYAMDVDGAVPEPLLPPQLALQNPELVGGYSFHVHPRRADRRDDRPRRRRELRAVRRPAHRWLPGRSPEAFGGRRSHLLDSTPRRARTSPSESGGVAARSPTASISRPARSRRSGRALRRLRRRVEPRAPLARSSWTATQSAT